MASGIYKIQSQQFPDLQYIGSAIDFDRRKKRHFRELKSGTHFNYRLQSHANKFGINDLQFVILEIVPKKILQEVEQFYIDVRKPFFNINPVAKSRLGSKHSIKTKLRISRSWKNRVPICISTRYARYFP